MTDRVPGKPLRDAQRPGGRPRVFVGLNEVAGYYGSLVAGLRGLGLDADLVTFREHEFAYGGPRAESLALRMIRAGLRHRGDAAGYVSSRLVRLFIWPLKILVFLASIGRYDVFVFGYGRTFTGGLIPVDLWLLRALGKRVILMFNGSDSRPPWLQGGASTPPNRRRARQIIGRTRRKKSRIRWLERWSDVIVSSPLHAQFHERPFVNSLFVGVPVDVGSATPRSVPEDDDPHRPVVALHAPSNPAIKGSQLIRESVISLQDQGLAIELREVIGQPHAAVLEALQACDLVIDQLYSDAPMAGLATEAAWFGVPSVVGGYDLEALDQCMPEGSMPPTLRCHPDRLQPAVRRLVEQPDFRRELGEKARAFVTARWNREAVARQYLRLFADEIPEEWLFDPKAIEFAHGVGISEQDLSERLAALLTHGGPHCLLIDDKPDLYSQVVRIAGVQVGLGRPPNLRRASPASGRPM